MNARLSRLLLVIVLAMIATLVVMAPANWIARRIANETEGALILADASGSLWHGSAVLSVSGTLEHPGVALALPGRIEWKFAGWSSLGARWTVAGQGLGGPVEAQIGLAHVHIGSGSAELPCELLDAAGGVLQTLGLRCHATLGWQAITLPATSDGKNAGSISLSELSSALSPIRPLGDYRVDWVENAAGGLDYQVTTLHGSLLISGQGKSPGSFSGAAQIAPTAAPETAERLRSMLATLGPSGPGGTLLQY
jgi:general secretion pathway protein N